MDVALREATLDDVELVKWALYEAVAWNPDRRLPPFEETIEHPELARYHRGWGRPGDLGVIATIGGEIAGVVLCRLFTEEDHGHGYVDDETPEVAIAVAAPFRREGLGMRLMNELERVARAAGIERLGVSIDTENPAARLAERFGYRELSRDEGGRRMVKDI